MVRYEARTKLVAMCNHKPKFLLYCYKFCLLVILLSLVKGDTSKVSSSLRRSTSHEGSRVRHFQNHLMRSSRNVQGNEHEPRFEHSEYQRTIDENIAIGSSVLTVSAIDEDLDQYGFIQYELKDTNDFMVDQGGIIYTTNNLDYESTSGIYRFQVVAKNPYVEDEATQVPVTIQIRDKPDAPVFDSKKYYFNISEFAYAGDYVGTVVARDSDNDLDYYSLQQVSPTGLFVIEPYNGIITVGSRGSQLDYVYNFQAAATDGTNQITTVPVVVNVVDENTNKPMFENCSGYNNFMVTENGTVPQDVLIVKATDADYGQNGVVEYFLLNTELPFSIDAVTGQLSVQRPLDRDRGSKEHFVTVIAKDLAENPLQNSCSFTIIVKDVNDNPPVFDQGAYSQTVPSDTDANAPILRLTTSDADAGRNAEIVYSLEGSEEDLRYFEIDPTTGYITLKTRLSQDMINREFTLIARASDRGEVSQIPLSSTVEVFLSVVSPGNMPPSVDGQIPEAAVVSEGASRDTNIVSICARSNSDNNQIFMDMINGNLPETNSEGTFDVRMADTTTTGCPSGTVGGSIYLATDNLDYEIIQTYTLIVQLTNDNGRSEYSLTVRVNDVNDNPPVLQQPYTGSISENVNSTIVMLVQAIDKDVSLAFRELNYSFENPPPDVTNNFRINSLTGEIWNTRPLDREEMKHYRIPVQVSDGENVQVRQYWISVNDRNDEPPRFNLDKGIYVTNVDEDLTVGKDTGIVLVVEDEDILNEFSYQIISGNDEFKFSIDPETGIIRVNKELDYDSPVNDRNFTMDVRVSDGKSYDTTKVRIVIMNKNDQAPVFSPNDYTAIVTENIDCDVNVTQVFTYDPDYPIDGDIIYSLNRAEQSNFTIDSRSGVIMVKGCLDREVTTLGIINIYPIAFDEGGKGKNSEPATVQITIRDVNDNHPYIQSPPNQYAQFMENVSPEDMNTMVVIRLSDMDDYREGNGCPCTLAFDESTPPNIFENFDVVQMENENQYRLVTTKTLDREAQKFYVIPFLTIDNKGLSGVRHLTVEVGDQNDSPMSDGESKITVYNYRSAFPDIIIGSVYVTDADDYDVDDKTFELDPTTSSDHQRYFEVGLNTGNITMKRGTTGGNYILMVKVMDNVRKEEAKGKVHIDVIDLPQEAVMQSGSFFLQDISAREVVAQNGLNVYKGTSLYEQLKVKIGDVFGAPPEFVDIFYLVDGQRKGLIGSEVRFNIHGSPYYTSSHLNGLLLQHKNQIEVDLGIKIPIVNDNLCLYEEFSDCNGTSCQQELRADNYKPLVIESETATIVGVNISEKYTCNCGHLDPQPRACPEGFENYCYNGGSCSYTANSGLSCTCLDTTNYGPRCELLTARLKNGFAWFDALGTCIDPTLHLTFQSDTASAVLLYNGPLVARPYDQFPEDFLYLVLNNWVVEAYLNLGSGTNWISVPLHGQTYTAYDVYLSWTTNTISMTIPNCGMNTTEDTSMACSRIVSVPESVTSVLNAAGPLQIGGLAPMLPLHELETAYAWDFDLPNVNSFKGCISSLKYNDEFYDLNKTTYNKYYYRTCEAIVIPSRIMMSSESVLIIVGSLLILLLLVLFVLCLLRRRKKPPSYPDHLNEIVKETIGSTDIEGFGEKDMTQFDLKLLRVTAEGKLLNGYGTKGSMPDVAKERTPKKAPLARLSEGFNVEGFIGDNISKVDKDHPDFDDVRHYCYEGDDMSVASLSSLGSDSDEDTPFNYEEDWGPRFKRLAEIYGPQPDEEIDSDYEFPLAKSPPKKQKSPLKLKPSSSGNSSLRSQETTPNSTDGETVTVPYKLLNNQNTLEKENKKPPVAVIRGQYHEAVNPLGTYSDLAASKESWC